MCTNAAVLCAELRAIARRTPERIPELCTMFDGVDTPALLARVIDMPVDEMNALIATTTSTNA